MNFGSSAFFLCFRFCNPFDLRQDNACTKKLPVALWNGI